MRARGAMALVVLAVAAPTWALNKQGARATDESESDPLLELSGYLFGGGFVFNPTYAARPGNSGLAALRFGLHLDADLFHRWITLSYDENTFTDAQDNPVVPSEHDHIVGLLSTVRLPRNLSLTFAVHFEHDAPGREASAAYQAAHPGYQVGYSQSYVDGYARISFERGPLTLFAALGGFLWNPSYAARPDNSGIAVFRYVLHGEYAPVRWLALRLDLNSFSDRDEGWVVPTELDVVSTVALRWRGFELRLDGEADLNLGSYPAGGPHPPSPTRGLNQFYLATLLQWNFDWVLKK